MLALFLHALLCVVFLSSDSLAHSAGGIEASRADDWVAPVAGATQSDVLQSFIPPQLPWSSAHRGIDLRAATGQVLAPAAGEVTFVGNVVDRPVITIRHSNGLLSSFEPVESEHRVGDVLEQGDEVGAISDAVSHCASPCIHWGVREPDAWHIGSSVRDLYIDPAFLLGWTEPSVLWPIDTNPTF